MKRNYLELKKPFLKILLLFILSFTWSNVSWGQERPLYVPGEILVKFKSEALPSQINSIKSELGLGLIKKLKRTGVEHIKMVSNLPLDKVLSSLRTSGLIEYAEPNYLRYPDIIPNDFFFNQLWGLNNTGQTLGTPDADIDAPEAWNIVTGNPNFVVVVIDSGMDMSHPDLAANVWTNSGEVPANNLDDDGNGYVDDVHGWDFSGNDNNPSDNVSICSGHGTHVSGTIGAVGNNGAGISGINWNVKIMPLKVFRQYLYIYCAATDSDIIEAINYAADNGARVSNNSYGGGPFSQAFYDAIRASKALYIAAAGNDGLNNNTTPFYPASYNLPNIISVAATDHNDMLAYFSNYGNISVDLSAPGVDIFSTLPNNNYASYNGTSMATPHVVGTAAILWDQDPLATVNEIKWRLLRGVDPKGLPVLTTGRLNLNNSLNLPSPSITIDLTSIGSTTVPRGGSISYKVVVTNQTSAPKSVKLLVVARIPNGSEVTIAGPYNINMSGNQVITNNFTRVVPVGVSVGEYTLFGRAEVSNQSFDEDPLGYIIY